MSSLQNSKLAGTFGTIQIVPQSNGHGVVLCVTGRNYTVDGFLSVTGAVVKIPLNDAIRLHGILASAIVAAEAAAANVRFSDQGSQAAVALG